MRRTGWIAAALLAAVATAAVAGDDGFAEAKRALEAALQAKDDARAREAIARVAADQSEKAAKLLAAAATAAIDMDVYEDLVAAIGSFKGEPAVKEALRIAAADGEWSVRYLFVEGISRIERPEARAALFAAFDDKHEQVAANAMRAARLARLKEAVPPLIAALEKHEKAKAKGGRLQFEARRALAGLTGQSFTDSGDWRRWWEQAEAAFDPAKVAEGQASGDSTTVIRRVEERGEYAFVEKLEKGDIVVVGGHSDQCEQVLEALKLPFTFVGREKASETLAKIHPQAVLIFNCEGDLGKTLRGNDAKALTAFVERGGYLFTSDWGLAEVVNAGFPGNLAVGATMPEQPFDVKIQPSRAAEKHPYLRDVFPENPYDRARMKWTIDDQAFAIKMTAKAAALVESPDLASKYGTPVVAATFRHGKGSVLHVMGHFKMQKDEKGDGFALQQLLVNFIVEKQKFRKK